MADTRSFAPAVVLVADDEALIRMFTADYLIEAGYRVVEASSGAEALRLLETTPDVRVLLTDVEMPGGMDGLALVRAVQMRWPEMVVIVTSGRVYPTGNELAPSAGFLQKPVREEAVVRMIRERLAE
jgi:CheY-like chemotaxis protein